MSTIGAASGSDYFRYHGIWSPGVRLFRRLRFVGKAAVICSVFLLVIAQPLVLFLNGTRVHVDEAHREQGGLALARELLPLFVTVQSLRGQWHAAGGQATPAMGAAVGQAEQQLARIESAVARSGLDLAEPLKFTRQAFQPLKATAADAEAAFGAVDEFAQQLQRLMVAVADASGLSMDPEQASFHLALAATNETLQVMEVTGRLRDLGSAAIARKETDAFTRRIVQGDTYVLYGQLERLFARFERVAKLAPEHEQALAFQNGLDPVNAFVRNVRKSVLPEGGPRGDAAAYAGAGQDAVVALAALTQRAYDRIGVLLERRIASLQATRNLQIAGVTGGLVVALYLFWCFYLVTRGGMQEVTRHVQAMAAGDLSTRPRPWGRDEAADLMRAVDEMQDSLRMLIGQVRGCAEDILHASEEVSSGAADLSLRTDAATGRLQQTAATMDTIARAVGDSNRTIAESADRGAATARTAEHSQQVIGEVVRTMEEIQAASRRVGDIVGVIDGIAFQTNILALNAAVEAARAGEQGRGFAVVAAEVRSLAQRSATAAREIKQLIAESQGRTEAGTGVVHTAGQDIADLVRHIDSISGLLQQVRSTTAAQAQGVGEVSSAVAQLDQDTQRNAALVSQTTAAALSMKSKAVALSATAARFTLPA